MSFGQFTKAHDQYLAAARWAQTALSVDEFEDTYIDDDDSIRSISDGFVFDIGSAASFAEAEGFAEDIVSGLRHYFESYMSAEYMVPSRIFLVVAAWGIEKTLINLIGAVESMPNSCPWRDSLLKELVGVTIGHSFGDRMITMPFEELHDRIEEFLAAMDTVESKLERVDNLEVSLRRARTAVFSPTRFKEVGPQALKDMAEYTSSGGACHAASLHSVAAIWQRILECGPETESIIFARLFADFVLYLGHANDTSQGDSEALIYFNEVKRLIEKHIDFTEFFGLDEMVALLVQNGVPHLPLAIDRLRLSVASDARSATKLIDYRVDADEQAPKWSIKKLEDCQKLLGKPNQPVCKKTVYRTADDPKLPYIVRAGRGKFKVNMADENIRKDIA